MLCPLFGLCKQLETSLLGFPRYEDVVNLLQCQFLGLDDKEPDKDETEDVERGKDKVV